MPSSTPCWIHSLRVSLRRPTPNLHGRPDPRSGRPTFLAAELNQDDRHLQRLGKVASLEAGSQEGNVQGDTRGRREDRATGDQYYPYPRDGRGPASQLRPSGHADGARARGLLPVAALLAL